MSLLVFYNNRDLTVTEKRAKYNYCILFFSLSLSQFQAILVTSYSAVLMSLFQGHVACRNFTLTEPH